MIKISVGQALLILIADTKANLQTGSNPQKLQKLKLLYLCGALSESHRKEIVDCIRNASATLLKDYLVSTEPDTISEDPSRRYFETHFSYEILIDSLGKIDLADLLSYQAACLNLIEKCLGQRAKQSSLKSIEGRRPGYDYSEFIHRIKEEQYFQDLSAENCKKIQILTGLSCLAITITEDIKYIIPVDVYPRGYFSGHGRGRIAKEENENQGSHHLGLMKNYMPLPIDDLAYSEVKTNHQKSTDKFNFAINASWVKFNFKHWVHPFVTSISGATLALARVLNYFFIHHRLTDNHQKKLLPFLRCYLATQLYYLGGHSLFELLAPLRLPAMREAFAGLKNFQKINFREMFYEHNKLAFDRALDKTIQYNNYVLTKRKVLEVIKTRDYPPLSSYLHRQFKPAPACREQPIKEALSRSRGRRTK